MVDVFDRFINLDSFFLRYNFHEPSMFSIPVPISSLSRYATTAGRVRVERDLPAIPSLYGCAVICTCRLMIIHNANTATVCTLLLSLQPFAPTVWIFFHGSSAVLMIINTASCSLRCVLTLYSVGNLVPPVTTYTNFNIRLMENEALYQICSELSLNDEFYKLLNLNLP